MNDWLLPAGICAGWLVLFIGVALTLAYRRARLGVSTGMSIALLAAYWQWGTTPPWWKLLLTVPVLLMVLLNIRLVLSTMAEPLEKRIRVDGVKTGRVTALDLPGQIAQALTLGIINDAEAQILIQYDAKVLAIVNVDDFAPLELGSGADAA